MKQLPGIDLTTPGQKIFAGVLLVAVLFGLYYLLPPLVYIFAHLILAGALGLILLFMVINHKTIWNMMLSLSWHMTKWAVSKDKLGYMYRYHEYILLKINKFEDAIKSITGVKIELDRSIKEAKKEMDIAEREAAAATQQNKSGLARLAATKFKTSEQLFTNYGARLEGIIAQEKTLIEIKDGMSIDAEELKYTLDAKAQEYQMMKKLSVAAGAANAVMDKSSNEYKLFQESLKQIEDSVVTYAANIETLERNAKPIIERMQVKQEADANEGLALLEEYRKKKAEFNSITQQSQS